VYQRTRDASTGDLGQARFHEFLHEGRELSLDDAVESALTDL
jgi:hypothetical protein